MGIARTIGASRRAAWWSAAAATLLFTLVLSAHGGDGEPWIAFDDIGESITPFVAALLCGLTARKTTGRERVSWAMIGVGAGSWGIGQVIWTVFEVGLGREPVSPSVCDIGFLLSPPLIIAGLLLCVNTPAGFLSRLRGGLEALLISGGMLIAIWPVFLAPVVKDSSEGFASQAVTLAYPILDAIALAALLFTATRPRMNTFGSLAGVAIGIGMLAVADSTFWYLTTVKDVGGVHPSDGGWFGGFLVIAASALPVRAVARVQRRRFEVPGLGAVRHALRRRRAWVMVVLPELVALVGITVGVSWQGLHGDGMNRPLAYLITVLASVAVLYGMGVLAENHVLTSHLETRIVERTEQLAARERRYSALVENSFDATMVVSQNLVIQSLSDGDDRVFSAGAYSLVGRRLDEFADRFAPLTELLASSPPMVGDIRQLTWRLADRDGARFAESHITNLIDDPDVRGYIINTRDITGRVVLEQEMRHQAFHDQLSGLANRALFNDRGQHALLRAQRTGMSIAVLVIDLDGFKHVNDSLGHHAGDAVLCSVAAKLLSVARVGDTVARLGGDEFAILMEDLTDDEDPVVAAERIRAELREIETTEDLVDYVVTASIGVAVSDGTNSAVSDLLRDGDIAMYSAKAAGKDAVHTFERWMHDKARERFQLQSEMAGALGRGEFVVYYQPCWLLETGRLEGFEALIRWRHPVLGLIAPDQFIPLAEESGMIVPIGRWVLHEATQQLADWSRDLADARRLTMAVNVSARQIFGSNLTDAVHSAIEAAGIAPHRLILEITESVLVTDAGVVGQALESLKEQGVHIAIDDFGTGYSSLAYLQNLPIDILKVDKVFVSRLTDSGATTDGNLLGAIINLARSLGLATIAEGVELPGQARMLAEQGCDIGQGYLWSRPVPAADAWVLVKDSIAAKTPTTPAAPAA